VEDVGIVCFQCIKEEERFSDIYLEIMGKAHRMNPKSSEHARK